MVDSHELGPRLMQETRWKEAVACLSFDEGHLRNCFSCSWNLGWAYSKLERYGEAEPHLRRASDLDSTSGPAAWALAYVLLELDQLEEAENEALRSLGLQQSPVARRVLALAYMKQGRMPEAEALHLESLRLFPRSSQSWRTYADFLSERGRDEEAERAYRRAFELPADS